MKTENLSIGLRVLYHAIEWLTVFLILLIFAVQIITPLYAVRVGRADSFLQQLQWLPYRPGVLALGVMLAAVGTILSKCSHEVDSGFLSRSSWQLYLLEGVLYSASALIFQQNCDKIALFAIVDMVDDPRALRQKRFLSAMIVVYLFCNMDAATSALHAVTLKQYLAFYSLCEQLTRDTDGDGIVDQFGVYDYGWEEALVANGCSLFSEDGQHCLLNQSAQESAMQFARKIYQLNAGTDLSEKTFDEGRVAFRPMLFSEYRSYEPYPWRIKRSSNFEWDCIAMPSGTSVGGGNYSRLSTLMLGISQRTKHSRLSWELLKTIACTEEMQTMVYTELSGVSALHRVTESDEVARLLQMDSQGTASRGMSTLPAIMEDTLATPRFARYHQAMESADRLITEAMSADKNFELQLLQIQQQLDVTLTS